MVQALVQTRTRVLLSFEARAVDQCSEIVSPSAGWPVDGVDEAITLRADRERRFRFGPNTGDGLVIVKSLFARSASWLRFAL